MLLLDGILLMIYRKSFNKKLLVAMWVYIAAPIAAVVLLILAYRSGMAVAQSNIIEVYCQSNPACSVESYATLPAVLMLACVVLQGIAAVKALKLKK